MADLELQKVVKRFGSVEVIHGIDLMIDSGEFVVFVGPSGCGKSTLLRMIAGLESVTEGDVLIDGDAVNDVPAAKRGLAMVFQSYALYPHMSVRKNLSFGLETMGAPKAEIVQRVAEAADILQIGELLDRKPGQLSGGQRQRVAIGRAIVREPKIFLFDEPLSNLDAELRMQMRIEINKLHRRLGSTMIFVTHDQVEAMTLADRIVVLRAGVVEQIGTPLELYNRPQNLFVAGFIGSPRMNFMAGAIASSGDGKIDVRLDGGLTLSTTVAGVPPAVGDKVTLGIRPEDIAVAPPDSAMLAGEVQITEHLGGETFVYVNLQGGQPITVEIQGQASVGAGEGAHGGGDRVMLGRLFDRANVPPDKYGRAASEVMGAWSILTGIAANASIASGAVIDVDRLLADNGIALARPSQTTPREQGLRLPLRPCSTPEHFAF